jgi:hypothetical protein
MTETKTSHYIAKLMGPVLLAMGASMLLDGPIYHRMIDQYLSSYAFIYLSGLLALPLGIAILLAHNVWAPDWRILITLFGWLAMVGGVFRIVYPQLVQRIGGAIAHLSAVPAAGGLLMLVLGGVLSYFGYRADV